MMSKILVTGATGNLGSAVIDFLLAKTDSTKLAALTRTTDSASAKSLKAKGVEVRVGDYDNYPTLVEAFKGIDKLYFVSGSDVMKRTQQHEKVLKASKEAGVKHVVYTSFVRNNETETSPIALVASAHIKTELWLKESGMDYTILKHNIYMDMLPMFLGDKLLENGLAYFPAGEGKIAFTLRQDMAEVASVILTTEGHTNKTYEITSDKASTMAEIATAISEVSGKKIAYVSPTNEEYIQTLSGAGVPIEYVGMFAGFAEAFKQGEFEKTNNIIEELLGRKPVSINQFVKKVYSQSK